MKAIKGVDLKELVEETASHVIESKKKSAVGLIKNLFFKVEGLNKDIDGLKKQLTAKEQSLEKTLNRINKLKAGDWSVLKEEKNG
jgi:seryl-tRNA synthetase